MTWIEDVSILVDGRGRLVHRVFAFAPRASLCRVILWPVLVLSFVWVDGDKKQNLGSLLDPWWSVITGIVGGPYRAIPWGGNIYMVEGSGEEVTCAPKSVGSFVVALEGESGTWRPWLAPIVPSPFPLIFLLRSALLLYSLQEDAVLFHK